jgi:hypothetical protein
LHGPELLAQKEVAPGVEEHLVLLEKVLLV